MKTALTLEIEKAIFKESGAAGMGIYGAFEVAIGEGYGNEYVDYMTMKSNNEFRCYEIKISYADFKSGNALSFYGDFNNFVMPVDLYSNIKEKQEYFFGNIGVYVYKNGCLSLAKKPKRKIVRIDTRIMLMHCMIRSLSRLTTKEHTQLGRMEEEE